MPSSTARLLLLLPTTTYRTQAFVEAATKLGVDLVCASERPSMLEERAPESLITLDFADPDAAAESVARVARRRPIHAVVAVDDLTTVVAAATFCRIRRLADLALGAPPRSDVVLPPGRRRPPRLTEPWFC